MGAWTAGGNIATARQGMGGAGTQTAGLGFGGRSGTTNYVNTEEYDGAAWAAGGDLSEQKHLTKSLISCLKRSKLKLKNLRRIFLKIHSLVSHLDSYSLGKRD